jgi:hypothetical protein
MDCGKTKSLTDSETLVGATHRVLRKGTRRSETKIPLRETPGPIIPSTGASVKTKSLTE